MTDTEFARQVENYVAAGFAAAAGLGERAFRNRLAPLEQAFLSADDAVIVLKRDFATPEKLVEAIDRDDGKPDTVIGAEALAAYGEREGVAIPEVPAYVIHGIDKQPDTRNVAPSEALDGIMAAGRSPLTIEEGLALWRHFPDVIAVNDGLSLAGSTRGDKRVPAIWISKKKPKLGWCFFGVPHTWLATASLAGRVGGE